LTGALNKHCCFGEDRKPLNMILDDGGDLTNMVFDKYPELIGAKLKVYRKKQLPEFTAYMSV
jgi:S-adenosylhomocysteine hydrolase